MQIVRCDEEEITTLVMKALGDENLIVPFFQPIMNTQDSKVEIHELLMRLRSGDAIVPAAEFVEQAEAMGLMHKLDLILIRKAFEKIREERYSGVLFVNISPKSLIAGHFVARVRELARLNGITPGRIVFEITERDTVKNLGLLETFVAELKQEGFRFAVDDFGSGFSSFQYIKSFSIDFLKINGEFIINMSHDFTYRAFVKSIVTLAKELGIRTIAEFVESAEVLNMSGDFGIDYAQGHHVGSPSGRFWERGVALSSR